MAAAATTYHGGGKKSEAVKIPSFDHLPVALFENEAYVCKAHFVLMD